MILGERFIATKLTADYAKDSFPIRMVQERLHPTKGWRLVRRYTAHVSRPEYRNAPACREYWRPIPKNRWFMPSEPGRMMRGRSPQPCKFDPLRHRHVQRDLRQKMALQMQQIVEATIMGIKIGAEPPYARVL